MINDAKRDETTHIRDVDSKLPLLFACKSQSEGESDSESVGQSASGYESVSQSSFENQSVGQSVSQHESVGQSSFDNESVSQF